MKLPKAWDAVDISLSCLVSSLQPELGVLKITGLQKTAVHRLLTSLGCPRHSKYSYFEHDSH